MAQGTLQQVGGPEHYTLTFQKGERQAVFDVRAGSVLNPLASSVLQQFHCPSIQS
jgi:type VI protein secretion system component VasK